MRIVLLGSSDLSIPSLIELHQSKFQLVSLITPSDKPRGRGKIISISKLRKQAIDLDYPAIQMDNFENDENINILKNLFADIFVVVAFKMLPDKILNIPKYGCINIHPSELPKYRGAAPIQYALMNGDKTIGISIIKLSSKIDSGNILYQTTFPLNQDDNYGDIHNKASLIGAKNLIKTIKLIESDPSFNGKKQNNSKRSYAKKIFSKDCVINWNLPSLAIYNKIRALSPKPGAFTFLGKKRFKIYKSTILHDENINNGKSISNYEAGDIYIFENQIFVKTLDSFLCLLSIQLEGKKMMSSKSFLKGNKLKLLKFCSEKTY